MSSPDTIVAISSATGPATRMIVRLSGPAALDLAGAFVPDLVPAPSTAHRCRLRFGAFTLPTTVYTFLAPRSYTGEQLVELHLPGNPLLARRVVEELLETGARLAEPGEFTARAYFHGRLDLTEAEGVAATISAHSAQELRAARQLLSGELARRLTPVMELIAETLALVEVGIDFTEEDVTFLSSDEIHQRVIAAEGQLAVIVEGSARFERLTHEPRAVLVGRPNAGKSTLLNALAGRERAVVSSAAGTTRDVISAEIALPRGLLWLVDVAGMDDADEDPIPTAATANVPPSPVSEAHREITRQMRTHALREIETADYVVLVQELGSITPQPTLPREPDLVVWSKWDLSSDADSATENKITVSAATGHHLERLKDHLDVMAFGGSDSSALLALNARHRAAIAEARVALERAMQGHDGPAELIAVDLREALDALGRVLGNISPDDLLGRIFSKFCIGK